MNRVILSIMLALGVATAAWAGYNIKQNPDGSTSLVNEVDGREILHLSRDSFISKKASDGTDAARLDETHLVVRVADIGVATAAHVAVPVTGTVTAIYGVANTGPNARAVVTVGRGNRAFHDGKLTFASGLYPGTSIENAPTDMNYVTPGSVIMVQSDGLPSNTVEAMITVVIRR